MDESTRELEKRLKELAERAFRESHYIFTDFLNSSQLSVYYEMKDRELSFIQSTVFGGMEGAERAMVRFGSLDDFGFEEAFPLKCLKIAPAAKKFAEELGHRDFLGAVMGLGLGRHKLGDLIVKDNAAYLFADEFAADYIHRELGQVRHTTVRVTVLDQVPDELKPELVEKHLIVASNRVDAVISQVYHLSREQSLLLFKQQLVSINGRIMTENAKALKEEDVVAVRGHGKFLFAREEGRTRKDRLNIWVEIYT